MTFNFYLQYLRVPCNRWNALAKAFLSNIRTKGENEKCLEENKNEARSNENECGKKRKRKRWRSRNSIMLHETKRGYTFFALDLFALRYPLLIFFLKPKGFLLYISGKRFSASFSSVLDSHPPSADSLLFVLCLDINDFPSERQLHSCS